MALSQSSSSLSDRIENAHPGQTNLLECPICKDILWKPVACQSCETPFCVLCIKRWLFSNSKCPCGCEQFIERKCPRSINILLSDLQIACCYKPNGCNQVLLIQRIYFQVHSLISFQRLFHTTD